MLQRAFAVTAAGIEGGKNLAESAKDMERIRRTMAMQLADFETMKKALMKDLQDRCEKVVELEMSLDETKEQYNTVVKASNMKAQQRKMDFLTRNLDQLVSIQRQVRICFIYRPINIELSFLARRPEPSTEERHWFG